MNNKNQSNSSLYIKLYEIYDDGDENYINDYIVENLSGKEFNNLISKIEKLCDKYSKQGDE